MPLPLPEFYRPEHVGQLYLERAGLVAEQARAYVRRHRLRPAGEDTERVALFGVDVQVAFCLPGASLFVPGAVEDNQRALAWLYRNLDRVTELVFTLDTHHAHQVFHPSWWVDAEGLPPPPLTSISAAEVRAGRWRAVREPEATLDYLEKLEAQGRCTHTVWPFHALLGGVSHALVPAVMEAALFHSFARQAAPHFEQKGQHPLTEHYSVLRPEVTEVAGRRVGHFNEALYARLLSHDRVYLFGQARSHCVRWTLLDLRERILATEPALARKLYVLEDATSPVPSPPLHPLPSALDFHRLAEEALALARECGMHVVRTTDPLD